MSILLGWTHASKKHSFGTRGRNGSTDSSVLTTLVGCCRERGGEGVFSLISARRLNLFPWGPAEEASWLIVKSNKNKTQTKKIYNIFISLAVKCGKIDQGPRAERKWASFSSGRSLCRKQIENRNALMGSPGIKSGLQRRITVLRVFEIEDSTVTRYSLGSTSGTVTVTGFNDFSS